MKSLQHSAVNYCLGIEGRLQILCRLMKHESAGSCCKEWLNIICATADTGISQSLFLHWLEHQRVKTGLKRHITELWKAANSRETSDLIHLPLNSVGLWVPNVHVGPLKESLMLLLCLSALNSVSFTRWTDEYANDYFIFVCMHRGMCAGSSKALSKTAKYGSPLLTHSFLSEWTERPEGHSLCNPI